MKSINKKMYKLQVKSQVKSKQGLKYLNGRFYFCIKVFSKKYLIYGYYSFNFFYVSFFLWIAYAYFAIDISDI